MAKAANFDGAITTHKPKRSSLGQAKLNIRFPFQGFQNSMRVGGQSSLFIMTKILRKQCKNLINAIIKIIIQYNNEKFAYD